MSPALEQAFSEIEKGAVERLEELRKKKERAQKEKASTGTVPQVIGHVEKIEKEDTEEKSEQKEGEQAEKGVGAGVPVEGQPSTIKETGDGRLGSKDQEVTDKAKTEHSEETEKKQRSTLSISKLKEERKKAKAKEQEKRWSEATSKGLGEIPMEGLDLEVAMLSPEESEQQQIAEKGKTAEKEGYGKVYTKTHEKRAERSMTRAEKKEQNEKRKKQEAALKEAQEATDRMAQDEARRIIERAQLEEEELSVQKKMERRRKRKGIEDKKETEAGGEGSKATDSAATKKKWKEDLGLKARKRKRDEEAEEEEVGEVDDEDKDPDYDPDGDPEQEFVLEDTELDEEETFKIEKHVHAINLQEAGDYVVEIRRFVNSFGQVVCKAKGNVGREYRKLIHYLREMALKINAYGPIEYADEEAVYKTIVDPTCTAWCRAMHGVKTGNSKDIQRIEEKRLKVQRSIEDREIPPEEEMVEIAGPMKEKTEEDKKHAKEMIKRFWAHTARAHEEAVAAANILRLLPDEVDENTYVALLNAGTRPLIMLEMPQMSSQAAEMKRERERQEKAENLQNQPIAQIIQEQNVPVPVTRWVSSNIMGPTLYLSAMVYYFVYAVANPETAVTNKGVAGLFGVSPSNLHKLVSGKRYLGGSQGVSKKASTLKELEEHGESMVKVCKKTTKTTSSIKGVLKSGGKGGKRKSTVTVTKTTPESVPSSLLDDKTPAAGTRGARKRKKGDDDE